MAYTKGARRFIKPVGNPADPDGLHAWMLRYLTALAVKNYSPHSLRTGERSIREFILWCDTRSLARPTDITKPILERYQRHLYHYRRPKSGEPLSFYSQRILLSPLRGYFRWLTQHNHLLYNPASELKIPKLPRRLPKHVLSVAEMEKVLAVPNLDTATGLRDRAVLETLYSTGMRRMELIGLRLYDVDVDRRTVFVRQGKGQKDRVIPIGERALAWIGQYLREVRPQLVLGRDEGTLFLSRDGDYFNAEWLSAKVAAYIDKADIGKRGSCHLFRHTMATLMLEGGADIRYIQAMLGHAKLSTTEIYTKVSIGQLQRIHAATHPAKIGMDVADEPEAACDPPADAETLLSMLDAEADEDPHPETLAR